MEELNDYSGDFRPGLKLQDFSKEALERLFHATAKLYVGLDGLWHSLMREKFGEQMANELDSEIWKRATALEVGRVREAMDIRGDDLVSFLKFLQVDPGAGGDVWPECEWQLKDKDHAILTIKRCRGLDYYERHGDMAALLHGCGIEEWGLQGAARLFNPKIRVTCLKLPPRQSKDDITCRWEFTVEE